MMNLGWVDFASLLLGISWGTMGLFFFFLASFKMTLKYLSCSHHIHILVILLAIVMKTAVY